MRLIDADKLKEYKFVGVEYEKAIDEGIKKSDDPVFAFECGWNDALQAVSDYESTVDAEPVVRCKDCKHYDYDGVCLFKYCRLWDKLFYEDFYCGFAERKEETEC